MMGTREMVRGRVGTQWGVRWRLVEGGREEEREEREMMVSPPVLPPRDSSTEVKRTLEGGVELVDLASHREVHSLLSVEVQNESSEGSGVDLVLDDQGLASASERASLERVLETLLQVLLQGLSGGDRHLDLSTVGAHDLSEVGNGLLGLVETSVLGEDLEKVLADLRVTLGGGLLEESVDASRPVLGREDGVGEELLDGGLGGDDGANARKVGLDLLEGGGALLEGSGKECSCVLSGETCGSNESLTRQLPRSQTHSIPFFHHLEAYR